MARRHTSFQSFKSIASAAALAGLGLVILVGMLDGPAAQLAHLLCTAARETLGLLPYFLPAAWQALHAYAFDHQPFSPCALQMLVSCWPLLRVVAGAV
jgi:hypothetical protein